MTCHYEIPDPDLVRRMLGNDGGKGMLNRGEIPLLMPAPPKKRVQTVRTWKKNKGITHLLRALKLNETVDVDIKHQNNTGSYTQVNGGKFTTKMLPRREMVRITRIKEDD